MIHFVNLPHKTEVPVHITEIASNGASLISTDAPVNGVDIEVIIGTLLSRKVLTLEASIFLSLPSQTSITKVVLNANPIGQTAMKPQSGGIYPYIDILLTPCKFDQHYEVLREEQTFKDLIGHRIQIDPEGKLGSVFGVLIGLEADGYILEDLDAPVKGRIIKLYKSDAR